MAPWGLPEPVSPTSTDLVAASQQAVTDAADLVASLFGRQGGPAGVPNITTAHSGATDRPDQMTANVVRRHGRPRSYVRPVQQIDHATLASVLQETQ